MTKAWNNKKAYMAIILCIIIILISACSFVRIADYEGENAQFFAARLYLLFAPPIRASFSSGSALKIISWIRRQDATVETESALFGAKSRCDFFADKPVSCGICKSAAAYIGHKPVSYVLRI